MPKFIYSPPMYSRRISAIALLSGGLDSALAIHLVKHQGIEVTALHFASFFSPLDLTKEDSPVQILAKNLEVPLIVMQKGDDFLELIRNPRYGLGKNLNPCIDCRIYTFIKAKKLMEDMGASFIVTGEVAGQRPMSQRKNTMRLIDKRSGCEGLVLRPLSAKILPTTIPENEGFVDRERLLGITGRGRKTQLALAEELRLTGYSPPAGGCLLTDPGFARRLRDLLDDRVDISKSDLDLLRMGRHIRLRPGLKIVVGRNEDENNRITDLAVGGILFAPKDFPGPVVLAPDQLEPEEESLIGSILMRYVKESARGDKIAVHYPDGSDRIIPIMDVAGEDWIAQHMI
ncbi:MAG: tRNA 4-thiouridine(8) synthase ThiI [Desulfomonilaceae bacterium]